MVLKSSQKYFYSLPSLLSRKVLAGGVHKSDFEMLECPGSYYTPAQERAFCITPDVFCTPGFQKQWPTSHNTPTPAPVNPSTKPPSTDHILPAEADKTWPGGSIYNALFSGKTHSLPYFSSQDVSTFQIFKSAVACCNISWQWRQFFKRGLYCSFIAHAEEKKNFFIYEVSEMKHKGGRL